MKTELQVTSLMDISDDIIEAFIDTLKLPDYANIVWNKSCMCERCNYTHDEQNAEMIGWVETDYGPMAVFECQKCFEK